MSKKTVVILQSNYIPWKGYFDLMREADLFIFLDDVQYTHDDWRNRNKIMTANGPTWLTIPAGRRLNRLICEVEVVDQTWKKKHRRMIEASYSEAPFFEEYECLLATLYDNDITNLSDYNQAAVKTISRILGIKSKFADTREIGVEGSKTERLIGILQKVGATKYVSGPAARDYIVDSLFEEAGIELSYKVYPDYPEYPQRFQPFVHQVSVLDLLFNVGSKAPDYIWGQGGVR